MNVTDLCKTIRRWLRNRLPVNFTSFNTLVFLYITLRLFVDGIEEFIILPTAWYYIKSFGETDVFLGFTLAAYSIGALVFAPCIGFVDGKLQATKTIVLFGGFVKMIGNLLYSIPFNAYFPLFGRFISGIAEGSLSVLFGAMAKCTDNENRAKVFLFFDAFFGVGTAVGPMVGSILTFDIDILGWRINAGNSPGFILTIIWILLLILSLFLPSNLDGDNSVHVQSADNRSSGDETGPESATFYEEQHKFAHSKIFCLYFIAFSFFLFFSTASFYTPLLAKHQLGLRLIPVKVLFVNSTLFSLVSYLATYLFLFHFSEMIVLLILVVSQIVPISILFYFALSWNDTISVNGAYLLLFSLFFANACIVGFPLTCSLLSKVTPINRASFYQSLNFTTMHSALIFGRLMGGVTFDKMSMTYACVGLTVVWLVELVWLSVEYRNLIPNSM